MNLTWRILIILGAVLVCLTSVIPPSERLGLGKDLAGGTTIVYRISPDEDGNPPTQQVVDQIISVIRQRIDPQGIFDISIVPQGTSQIEITMPAPTPEVKLKRDELNQILDEIGKTALSEIDLDAALKSPPDQRQQQFADLSKGVPERLSLLEDAAAKYDAMIQAKAAYDEAFQRGQDALKSTRDLIKVAREKLDAAKIACIDGGIDEARINQLLSITDPVRRKDARDEIAFDFGPLTEKIDAVLADDDELKAAEKTLDDATSAGKEELKPLEEKAAKSILNYEASRKAVLATSLSPDEVRRVLDLSQEKKSARDSRTQKIVIFPSPREQSIERLEKEFPLLTDKIQQAIKIYDEYKSLAKGYDDPKDLISLLRGAGVLNFRIGVQPSDPLPIDTLRKELREGGPNNIQSSTQVRWFGLDKLEQWYNEPAELERLKINAYNYFLNRYRLICDEFDGEVYMLLWTTADRSLDENSGEWQLTQARPTQDQAGRPAVNFTLDAGGAALFRNLTSKNKQRQMAIVLDDRVYSAPTIQSTIGKNGQITGNFSQRDIEYLLRVLNAGSLQAKLKGPVAQTTIGPALGADNLKRGLDAGYLALIVVGIFMIIYYFFSGVVANVALLLNAIFILGIMALYQAAFTMPGIAGIVLTFGMAVDSNVLIYERIREELEAGADLKTAVRLGFEKVLSTIVDANVTNLIVCFVLGFTATAEVKGFALTLGIGIVSTLFCALFVTRVIFDLYVNILGAKHLPMLPTVWGFLNRIMNPNVRWVHFRKLFFTLSGIAVLLGIFTTNLYWNEMLDTVFKGGTSVTITFGNDPDAKPMMVPRAEVESKIENWARDHQADLSETEYNALKNVTVLNLNIDEVVGTDFRGNQFVIKSTLESTDRIEEVINTVFQGQLNLRQPIHFDAFEQADSPPSNHVFPILEADLGKNINDSTVSANVRRDIGGAAIVLRNLTPVSTLADIEERIERIRQSEEFKRYAAREAKVFGITPTTQANADGDRLWKDVVVTVNSPNISIFQDRSAWDNEVAAKEWQIVRRALTEPPSLDQVTQIGAEVAAQFRAKAIVAIGLSLVGILVYIWFRFGSLRYSLAAIVALVHDVSITLGLLAITHALYNTQFGKMFYIEPFKIDLGVIAALLTIIGYSLNDTIVILDRVRENRGKLAITSEKVVNTSINQTMSRTLITSGTTLLAVIIMYSEGGTGIRPFTYAMLCGVVVGTYSSIAIAAPMVYSKKLAAESK